jgi:Acetyl-coenzyme A synthetase N-terminus
MERRLVPTLMSGGLGQVEILISIKWLLTCAQQTARETLHWYTPFHTVRSGGFVEGDVAWFPEGTLNASYNCVDRWAFKHPDKVLALRFASAISVIDCFVMS